MQKNIEKLIILKSSAQNDQRSTIFLFFISEFKRECIFFYVTKKEKLIQISKIGLAFIQLIPVDRALQEL